MDQSTLRRWHRDLDISHKAHIKAAAEYERQNLLLGIPVVVLSSVVGTSVFASVEPHTGSYPLWIKILAGSLSILAAALAGLQTFLRYPELAERHKAAAVKYGAVTREVEEALATNDPEKVNERAFLSHIRVCWEALEKESPVVPERIYGPIEREHSRLS